MVAFIFTGTESAAIARRLAKVFGITAEHICSKESTADSMDTSWKGAKIFQGNLQKAKSAYQLADARPDVTPFMIYITEYGTQETSAWLFREGIQNCVVVQHSYDCDETIMRIMRRRDPSLAIHLEGLVGNDERVIKFWTTQDYMYPGLALLRGDIMLEHADLRGALEESLHRLLFYGASEDEVRMNMCAQTGYNSLDEDGLKNSTYIDLDYYIPGELLHVELA